MLQTIFLVIWGFVEYYTRPLLKWILRRLTGKCELLRITTNNPRGALRTVFVERAIRDSKNPEISQGLDWFKDFNYDEFVTYVITVKNVSELEYPSFRQDLLYCLQQIHAYRRLVDDIHRIKSTPFQPDNLEHQELLSRLWKLLLPEDTSPVDDRRWSTIGFQSDRPVSDFRGMGLLSLENLVYFADRHALLARSVLSASNHPQRWYPFAVVGINITEMLYTFLKNGDLKNQFYNTTASPTLVDFHKFFCFALFTFHEYWVQTAHDIMFFNYHREHFRCNLLARLREYDCRLGLTGGDGDVSSFSFSA